MGEIPLHVVTAMPSEARPLVDAHSLRSQDAHGLRIASGPGLRVAVVGIGQLAMASGVGFLAASFPGPAIWLNLGIAGHGRRPFGEVVMAHSVHDRGTGLSLYPPLVIKPPAATSKVVTVSRPETDYPEDAAYDMEAFAFVAAARRFQTAELVHVLKVVSDGPDAPIAGLTREKVTRLIEAALPAVHSLESALRPLAAELGDAARVPDGEEELLARWHFTTSDRRALRRELVRGRVLDVELPELLFANAKRGRDVVKALQEFLDLRAVETSP